ncbi:MarR family winged helix-turn-helix transcriptional regulator [Streptacidiphilus griseoplanus]|uniref:MarR family winged helix-turn-helix transcriptional regulator n=1 Tax=Peterkaempfera griseoplana TaxID=66896 RepID=UPI0006E36205|nr:MarR family transcriptional regulator [Peterkaempfera griseoplana]
MSEYLDTCLRLARAQAVLVKRFDNQLGRLHGLSFADFVLLQQLGSAPGGRMRRVDLAAAVGLTASGVTRSLGPLERIGLVEREPDPRDARVAYAALTEAGRERLQHAEKAAGQLAASVLGGEEWAPGEVASLAGYLARLGGTGLPGPTA